MRHGGWRRHHRPPWWPANEAWPPAGRAGGHWRGRTRFIGRIALLVGLVLSLSSVGIATLVSFAIGRAGTLVGSAGTIGLAVAVTIVGLVLAVAFWTAMRRVGLPLSDVVAAADRVAQGDFSTRVVERGPPFLRAMARAFNSMTGRLQEQDRQRRELMADIAHELRTPLAVVQGRIEGLLDGVYARDDAALGEVLEETRILARLVEDLGTLAHSERGTLGLQKEPTDLGVLFGDAARALAAEAAARGVTVQVEDAPDLPLMDIDPLRMREVLTNLIANAIRHSNAGTTVSVQAQRRADSIVAQVRDTGPGIPADELSKIFDRFHKGGRSEGSGLGLAIAQNLVVAHGGKITVESEVGRGTTVTVTLPAPTS